MAARRLRRRVDWGADRLDLPRFYGPLERSWRITDSIMKRVYFSSRDGK